ncbi:MAG: NUDIX domain-containing protein [Patescibacteria group bacterium]
MTETTKPKIIIVDENDKIIGYKNRGSLDENDIYRVSALWITNSNGQILLARRHHTKVKHPNMWGPAVAGTVEESESYEENIIKEMEEELGIKNMEIIIGPKVKIDNQYHHFGQWYTLVVDMELKQFKIQEDEVEEIKWFSPEEFKKQFQEHPEEFLPTMKKYFELFSPHN